MKKNNTVKCSYCGFVFIPDDSNTDYVDKIATYWCPNEKCGENFVEELEVKNYNYTKYNNKKEWS